MKLPKRKIKLIWREPWLMRAKCKDIYIHEDFIFFRCPSCYGLLNGRIKGRSTSPKRVSFLISHGSEGVCITPSMRCPCGAHWMVVHDRIFGVDEEGKEL